MAKATHEIPIQFRQGMVDPAQLLDFMHGCHCQDLERPRTRHWSEYHHVVFPLEAFKKNQLVHPEVKRVRNSKYNQVKMDSCQEDYFHQQVVKEVPIDQIDPDSARQFMRESDYLTNYAASSRLVSETSAILERSRSDRERGKFAARLALLEEMNEKDATKVGRISVVSPHIVVGSLSKYLGYWPESGLQDLIEAMRQGGIKPLETKVYSDAHLVSNAVGRLDGMIRGSGPNIRNFLPEPPHRVVQQYHVVPQAA